MSSQEAIGWANPVKYVRNYTAHCETAVVAQQIITALSVIKRFSTKQMIVVLIAKHAVGIVKCIWFYCYDNFIEARADLIFL